MSYDYFRIPGLEDRLKQQEREQTHIKEMTSRVIVYTRDHPEFERICRECTHISEID